MEGIHMKGFFVLSVALGVFLAVSVWFGIRAWTGLDASDVQFTMSRHGWLALFLGVMLTGALGAGLMSLVFHSSRSGHDDMDQGA